ncbi:hypothetical protein GCM10023258_07050 [Terrabacter aeriphilus]|uniref:Uncharacterized protein n=1 Tax=Terrabacter aeriphilus TaxID=515662 RepID=A0ABP9J3V0_9MICO
MGTAENPDAGQGPVLLDIGGDVGALVVTMPGSTDGLEVEIRPAGSTARASGHHHDDHDDDDHDHDHDHGHDHQHGHRHPHVAVVGRPSAGGVVHTLVYPSVPEGAHELVPLPDGVVELTVEVRGGAVTHATWPTG